MLEIRRTDIFAVRVKDLRDRRAKLRFALRIDRLGPGDPGNVRPVGEGVSEMRIDYRAGDRVCFCRRGEPIVLPLCRGDESGEERDIGTARRLAAML